MIIRKLTLAGVILFLTTCAAAQDFSNRGREFWLAYSYHVGMVNAGGSPEMTLYLTSDASTAYNVQIWGGPVLQTGTINAGQVVMVQIPPVYFIDDEGLFSNRAIRVTSDSAIVVYSYITRSAASGATLCLPVPVLGLEYYAFSFTQNSNETNSNSFFTIVAIEDNTTVDITPSANTKNGWQAGNTYTVSLNKGQIYQVLGVTNSNVGVDLTGSRIRSIASGTAACKRIAVFSGSGKVRIPAGSCSYNSSDNLYQQLYPTGSWGRKYLTVPSYNNTNNYFRILRNDPATQVYLNGTLIPSALFNSTGFYEFFSNMPNLIEADRPVSVAQYFTTQGCSGNNINTPNDPDMIMLNPVEQNISSVTLVSSNLASGQAPPAPPHQHHIHVIIRNGGTGISSFKLDGAPVPTGSWIPHPADPDYSYLYLNNISQGFHHISSDSGFNAIAYGYAYAESYGYSAGANVKDLYQFISVQNQYATVDFAATCKSTPFYFSMTFPYQPTEIRWEFSGLFPDVLISSPVYDSTWVVNGRQLYRYKLPDPYTISTVGIYTVKVLAINPTADGCSGEQEIDFELEVYERPVAGFSFNSNGCVSDSVQFTDNSNTHGRPAYIWNWDFGDGGTSSLPDPAHLYSSAGSYPVKFSVITDIGCLSDTVTQTVNITDPPVAAFGFTAPACTGQPVIFSDSSYSVNSPIVKWIWDFGDGSPVVTATTNASQAHSYEVYGSYQVTLQVETASGCLSMITMKQVPVFRVTQASFTSGNACLPGGMQFTNTTVVGNSTDLDMASWSWDFGDGNTSTDFNPLHVFSATGNYPVTLTVTNSVGCSDDTTITISNIYEKPVAGFTPSATEICNQEEVAFTDQSHAPGSTVTQWNWFFSDGTNSVQQHPGKIFSAPGVYTASLVVTSAAGCISDTSTMTIVVNPLPEADFSISSPQCTSEWISFTDNSTAGAGNIIQWTWSMGDGTQISQASAQPINHSFGTAGIYPVSLAVKTDKGCESPVHTIPLTVHPRPEAAFSMPANCVTDPYSQFFDQSTITDGTQAQFSYQWHFGDPAATSSNPNTSVVKNPQHSYSATGVYPVTLVVISGAGCRDSITQSFTINGTQPQAVFNIINGNEACSNEEVTIQNQSTVDFGSVVRLEIFWDYLNDPMLKSVIHYPAAGASYSHDYPVFYSPVTIDVQIRVVAYSGESCESSSVQTLTLRAAPQLQFTSLPLLCANDPVLQLTQGQVLNGLPGSGFYSGAGISSSGSLNPSVAGAGTHLIRYTYQGSNGCSAYAEQPLDIFPVPLANAGPDLFVLEGGNVTLLGSGSGNGISYSWTPPTGLNHTGIAQPGASPAEDIVYTLTVVSSDGCSSSDMVFVKVLKAPFVPNVFTPNGDGINDRWEIRHLESYPGATVQVFNRYGQPVFSSTGYSRPWDGSYNGKPLPAGTYYYVIDPKNGRNRITGFVDIIR